MDKSMKIKWKQNLLVAWIGCFFTGASISLVTFSFTPLSVPDHAWGWMTVRWLAVSITTDV
ncbi:hypothetical protein, partial [Enterococcus faecalis]|uniref:hypothetical protein n=1 Tax=Enterococcus faecalis TaxID=1351 RepID=UPI0025539C40